MNIYVVIAVKPTSAPSLKAAIEEKHANNFIAVTSDVWFVATSAALIDFSKNLGVKYKTDDGTVMGNMDGVIVIPAVLYWGFSDPTIWQWLSSKIQEKTSG